MWFKSRRGRNKTSLVLRTNTSYQHLDDESTIELTQSRSTDQGNVVHSNRPPWEHSIRRLGPLLGIGALCGSLASIAMAFCVLFLSNKSPIANWSPYQPNVYLSISTNLGNTLLRFALAQALPILWWRHAIRGKTVNELHKEWSIGQSVYQAATNWRFWGVTAFGTISCALLVVVGPLLQRASTTGSAALQNSSIPLEFQIIPELPTNWSGVANSDGSFVPSDGLMQVFGDYVQQKPIVANVTGCDGICEATIFSPGLATSEERCTSLTLAVNGNDDLASWPQQSAGDYLLFNVSFIYNAPLKESWWGPSTPSSIVPSNPGPADPERESIGISVVYSNITNWVGTVTIWQCWFVSAILAYDVVVNDNGTTTSTIAINENQPNGTVIALANNTEPLIPGTTMNATISILPAVTAVIFESGESFTSNAPGAFEWWTGRLNVFALKHIFQNRTTNTYRASDPLPTILWHFNEILFRGAVAAANSDLAADYLGSYNISQPTMGRRINKTPVFHSGYGYFAAASAFQVIAIVFNGVIFWKYWNIGREVSFSPIEIAKAFDAPVLRESHSNGKAEEIVKDLGNTRLRYGFRREDSTEDLDEGGEGKPLRKALVFGEYGKISPPGKEHLFTT